MHIIAKSREIPSGFVHEHYLFYEVTLKLVNCRKQVTYQDKHLCILNIHRCLPLYVTCQKFSDNWWGDKWNYFLSIFSCLPVCEISPKLCNIVINDNSVNIMLVCSKH